MHAARGRAALALPAPPLAAHPRRGRELRTAVKAAPLIERDGRPVLMLAAQSGQPVTSLHRLKVALHHHWVRYLLTRAPCSARRRGALRQRQPLGADHTAATSPRQAGLPGAARCSAFLLIARKSGRGSIATMAERALSILLVDDESTLRETLTRSFRARATRHRGGGRARGDRPREHRAASTSSCSTSRSAPGPTATTSAARCASAATSCRSSCSPRSTARPTPCWASRRAPTTTSPSRSASPSCAAGSAPCCAAPAPRRGRRGRCAVGPVVARPRAPRGRASTASRWRSRSRSSSCSPR